jgi:hypothetical protein
MFDIQTSHGFLAKLETDFADWEKEPGSSRLALNCALTAHHMHEWVWGEWLKTDFATWKALNIKDRDTFYGWCRTACPWLFWIDELANGTKHFNRHQSFEARRVSLLPAARNLPNAGAEDSHWDGPMPFLIGSPVLLPIDNGPDAGEHRWIPAGMLLEVVVRFWREFFDKYSPAVVAIA